MFFATTPSLLQLIAVCMLIYEASWVIYCRFFHPLRSIPGPFLASVSRLWVVLNTAKGDMEHTQRALHRKYGYLVRIAPNEVVCSDPSAIKTIYGIKNGFNKTDFYDAWTPPNTVGYSGHFATRDEKKHTERRRITNHIYSMSSILDSEADIDSCTLLFSDIMRKFARERKPVDLGLWLHMYAFDVLGELFYGKEFGMMRERKDIGNYMRSVQALLPMFTIGGTLPSYMFQLYSTLNIAFSPSLRGAVGAIQQLPKASIAAVKRRIQELEEKTNNKADMLRKMIEISADRGETINFTHEHIYLESITSLFAGADTTSIAMTSVLYYLMRNPAAYQKLKTEIDAAFSDSMVSTPIAYKAAIEMPYLKACINESMRLHPGVALAMPREVPPGGATISDFYFPAGYHVGINAAVVQYDKDVFGPDAEEFNPDRWLENDSKQMERAMIPFGGGSRTCIGKHIALCEVYKLIPQLLRDFDISPMDPQKEWETENYWFNKQKNVFVYFEERDHEAN